MRTPRGLKTAGRSLFRAVTSEFTLDPPELVLLEQAARMVDLLADLRAEVAETGLMVESSQGIRVNPAAVEARQLTVALSRTVQALGLPKGLVS